MKLPWLVIFAATVTSIGARPTRPIRFARRRRRRRSSCSTSSTRSSTSRRAIDAETILAKHPEFVRRHVGDGAHPARRRGQPRPRAVLRAPRRGSAPRCLREPDRMGEASHARGVLDQRRDGSLRRRARGSRSLRGKVRPRHGLAADLADIQARSHGRRARDRSQARVVGRSVRARARLQRHARARVRSARSRGRRTSGRPKASRRRRARSCILLRNASGVAFTRFRLREAEELGLRAHKAAEQDCDGAATTSSPGCTSSRASSRSRSPRSSRSRQRRSRSAIARTTRSLAARSSPTSCSPSARSTTPSGSPPRSTRCPSGWA